MSPPMKSCDPLKGAEWTASHYQLARQLMKYIRLLPPDWNEDVIQEVAAGYSQAFKTWRGTNFNGWLYMLLHHKAVDLKKKEEGREEKKEDNHEEKIRRSGGNRTI